MQNTPEHTNKKTQVISRQAIYLTAGQRDAIAKIQARTKQQCGICPNAHQVVRQLLDAALSGTTAQQISSMKSAQSAA